jgi:hypothetical protein
MGLFSFIETFFFISLAITFILILLLVYHFKQRILSLEEKLETMFDIVNSLVKEVTSMRYQPPTFMPSMSSIYVQPNITQKIIVSDDEDEEEDDDENTSDESLADSDAEEEEDDDEEEEEEENEIRNDENIKTVSMNSITLEEVPTDAFHLEEIDETEMITDLAPLQRMEEEIIVEKTNDVLETDEPVLALTETLLEEEVQEEKEEEEEEEKDEDKAITEAQREIYNKMSTAELRTKVIAKGLVSSASKHRRPELLKLLGV